MKPLSKTPIRRLGRVTYWVIEDPDAIRDFINTEIRKEWEADAKNMGMDPRENQWLKTLPQRKWSLETVDIRRIKLNPDLMSYVNSKSGYNFEERLAKRSHELKHEIETYGRIIWPVIVRKEDWGLIDGYCRYTALKAMNVHRIYAYRGT